MAERESSEGATREHKRAKEEKVAEGEHERVGGDHERASKEQGGAQREHMAEMGLGTGVIRRYRLFET